MNEFNCFYSTFCKLLKSVTITTLLLLLSYLGLKTLLLILVVIQNKS